jgi:hypothetical protein
MPSHVSLVKRLQKAYPGLRFVQSDGFRWSSSNSTVYYGQLVTEADRITLLHETAHGILGHKGYRQDVSLLGLERDAWTRAQQIAPLYHLDIDNETIETALDSYRDWLHARSLCPQCGQTGLQTAEREYTCLSFNAQWRDNDARQCGLKRYRTA